MQRNTLPYTNNGRNVASSVDALARRMFRELCLDSFTLRRGARVHGRLGRTAQPSLLHSPRISRSLAGPGPERAWENAKKKSRLCVFRGVPEPLLLLLALQPAVQLGMARGYERMSAAFKAFLEEKTKGAGGAPVTLTRGDVELFFEGFKRAQREEEEERLRDAAKNA